MKKVLLVMILVCYSFAFECKNYSILNKKDKECCDKIKSINSDYRLHSENGWYRAIARGDVKNADNIFAECVKCYYEESSKASNATGSLL